MSAATPPAPDLGFNITTSPLPIELTTTPGKTITTSLRVQNSGTASVRIKVNLLKFKAAGTDGKPQLLKRQPGDSFFDWVKFSQSSFVADPGVWNTINMTISPPASAAFGYYYAVVFSQDNGSQSLATPNSGKLTGATATLILLDVHVPGEKRQLRVTSFTASKKLYEYLPATFTVQVHNTGQIHAIPSGDIFIRRGGRSVATLQVNEAQGNVLPDSNRIFEADWQDGFPVFTTKRDHDQIVSDKQGKPVQQLTWDFGKANKLRFGHYTAHLLLTYDDGTRDVPIEAEVGFWVIPWKLLSIVLVVCALIAVGLWSAGRGLLRGVHKKRGRS